jgi:hypothetical protein
MHSGRWCLGQCRPCVYQLRSFIAAGRALSSSRPSRVPSPSKPAPQLSNGTPGRDVPSPVQKSHPQAPIPTRGIGPFTRHAETGKRLTFREREEEKAKEYLYEKPDLNQPLPPLLLRPPGLAEPPVQGTGHGKETRAWWQREFEIWFGRYQKPFDVQAQIERHKTMYYVPRASLTYDYRNSYHTEWSPKADRRSVRKTHGKVQISYDLIERT